jgi:hypothetical protein
MSNLGVDNIKGSDGISGPSITGNVVFSGTSHIVLPKGTTAERPTGVAAGSLRFNTDTKLVEQYNGVEWVTLNSYGVGRGVFGGGFTNTFVSTIDYITIATTGNAESFGNTTSIKVYISACSSSTRGVFSNGISQFSGPRINTNTLDYITIATTGNATTFGNLSLLRESMGACSSSTRGVFGGGSDSAGTGYLNTIDFITIATTGNATDFGDLTVGRSFVSACSSSTRGVFGSGYIFPTIVNTIEYITIATTGNATDFGDLTQTRFLLDACSSSTRGVFGGGYTPTFVNTIDYVTIATTGNAQDFGYLTSTKNSVAACSSNTRGVFGGGYATSTNVNTIDFITIATIGNATTFGQLTQARSSLGALSDAHGGLS